MTMIDFHTYQSQSTDDVLIVELSGKLDTDSADCFFKQLEEEVTSGHRNIVFDCHNLDHISSLGFGMMIRAHSRLRQEDGEIRFARMEGMIEEAFHMVGFHKLFDNYATIDAAVESIA